MNEPWTKKWNPISFPKDGGPPVMTDRLNDPMHWRKPQRIAVQFMGDLFHESVPVGFIDRVYEVMATTPQHTYLLLTKRPEHMAEYFRGVARLTENPNVFPGVSVSNQPDADRLLPILLQIPAERRWCSYEPAIGGVDFRWIDSEKGGHPEWCRIDALTGKHTDMGRPCPEVPRLSWIVMGGETGPGARPMHPDWARSVRDDCRAAGVPLWFKSWGEWLYTFHCGYLKLNCNYLSGIGRVPHTEMDGTHFYRVGRAKSGHLLDGEEIREVME